jgi:hypothetical protein|tara:strand:+ start:182 stop:361 length:180 start_codon:yes stop_codon:yes gene_type:complete
MSYNITTTEVEFDENSEEYVVKIPQDILEELDWREGDTLEWQFWDYDNLPGLRLHKVGE